MGIGIAEDQPGRGPGREGHLRIYVRDSTVQFPANVYGVRTEGKIVGQIRSHVLPPSWPPPPGLLGTRGDEWRPTPGGVAGSHIALNGWGTMGGKVYLSDGTPGMLSCNHVFANDDGLTGASASSGDAIVQPGNYLPGSPQKSVWGRLSSWTLLSSTGINYIDAAVATPSSPKYLADNILDIGGNWGGYVSTPAVNDNVVMSGARSGFRSGTVTDVNGIFQVYYPETGDGPEFDDQIVVENPIDNTVPFSNPGDSGSLILTGDTQKVEGLLFAGGVLGQGPNKPVAKISIINKASNLVNILGINFTGTATGYTGAPTNFEFYPVLYTYYDPSDPLFVLLTVQLNTMPWEPVTVNYWFDDGHTASQSVDTTVTLQAQLYHNYGVPGFYQPQVQVVDAHGNVQYAMANLNIPSASGVPTGVGGGTPPRAV